MSSEAEKQNRLRREALSGTFGPTPVDFLVHNKMFTTKEKQEIVEIAKRRVLADGRGRIYWEDVQLAIREWRNKGVDKSAIRKKAEEELEGLGYA